MNEELKVIISANVEKLKNNVNEAKSKIKDFQEQVKEASKNVDDNFKTLGDSIKTGMKVAAGAIAGVTTALLAAGPATAEYRGQMATLKTAFEAAGGTAEEAKSTYNDLFRVMGDSGAATEAAQHLGKLTTNEKDLAEWTKICQGVYGEFSGSLPLEGLTEAVNHTAKLGEVQGPLADALEWSGISTDAFNESLAKCNTEGEREKLIRETLSGIYSESAKLYEENNAQVLAQNDANRKMSDAMAKVGEAMAPVNTMLTELGADILTQLVPYIQSFAENYLPKIKEVLGEVGTKLSETLEWAKEHKTLLAVMAGIIGGIVVAIGLYNTVAAIKAAMAAAEVASVWGLVTAYAAQAAAMIVAIAPYVLIVAAIAAVIAIIVLCVKHWDEIKEATKKAWDAIVDAVKAAIDWVIELFQKIINWVKENWQGLLLLILNPFAGAFKLVYDNCEGFRNFVDNFIAKIKSAISTGFSWIKDKIVNPIKDAFSSVKQTFSNIVSTIGEKLGAAKNKVSEIINAIKGFFNFQFKWPKVSMPKFSISPSGWKVGDLLKGSIPKLSIKWNALGGVFDKPTLFGYGNSLQGIGENGAEAVVPLENNLGWLDKMAGMLAKKLGSGSTVVLQVDGKTFGQISVDAINGITRQTGNLPLVFA